MNKQWLEEKKKQVHQERMRRFYEIQEKIQSAAFLDDEDRQIMFDRVSEEYIQKNGYYIAQSDAQHDVLRRHNVEFELNHYEDVHTLVNSLDMYGYSLLLGDEVGGLKRYLDSNPVEFDGDIIITDPCYVIREDHHGHTEGEKDDWESCDYGYDMDALGITTYLTRDTLYGDWGCTVFDCETKNPIGKFCADAGLVSVFLLDEILKYNPDYKDHIDSPHCVTWIRDFKGVVQFVVEHTEGEYEDTTSWHKAGEKWEDYSVHVVGHGINRETGNPIHFMSSQTSL